MEQNIINRLEIKKNMEVLKGNKEYFKVLCYYKKSIWFKGLDMRYMVVLLMSLLVSSVNQRKE